MSSLPATPSRTQKQPPLFSTPSGRQQPMRVPSTAPVQRTSAMRGANVYGQQVLPFPGLPGPPSDGTVSASDNDSEAETDIIEPDEINESQASRAASQMLRSSQEQQAQRDSFAGRGILPQLESRGDSMRQSKLFGSSRKSNVVRAGEDEPPAKRARTTGGAAIGLGIAGVRQ